MTFTVTSSTVLLLTWIVATMIYKRSRLRASGSAISQQLRQQAVRRKEAGRRRMRDYLADPLLRKNLIHGMRKECENNEDIIDKEGWLEERLRDLDFQAKQPVTEHDVVVSREDILLVASRRIHVASLVFVLVLYFGWMGDVENAFSHIVIMLLAAVVAHKLDDEIFVKPGLPGSSSSKQSKSSSKKAAGSSLPFEV